MINPTTHRASFLASVILALAAVSTSANAQTIPATNLFTGATATANTQYPDNDPSRAGLAIDGTPNGFVFLDDPTGVNPLPNGLLNISNLTLSSDITSLQIYSGSASGREATSVTIYFSTSNAAVLPTQDDINANWDGGTTYTLTYSGSTGYQDQLPGNTVGNLSYATISGIDIPSTTKSVLFAFPLSSGQYGSQVDEIQAFGPVVETPEPSTWAMMLGGLATLGFIARRRSVV